MAVIENFTVPRRNTGCYEWRKNIWSTLQLQNARFILTEALWSASNLNQMIILYVHQENPFVSLHSNGPTHGSFQPCDHNLQFHTWLSAMAQVVWIAWVRHIPSTDSLFIVLIFRERFISFRKSSRKHWMPISCWPVEVGAAGTAGVEVWKSSK